MDLKDISYRVGLVLAAFLLAGIFAHQLLMGTAGSNASEARETARALSDAIGIMMTSEGGSSIEVSFGMVGPAGESALELPGKLDGERYRIVVLPGTVVLEWAGGREVVTNDGPIVPSLPPLNSAPANDTQLSNLMGSITGFGLGTPCLLRLHRPAGPCRHLFIYCLDRSGLGPFEDLSRLLDASLPPYPGIVHEVGIEAVNGAMVKERLLLFHGDGDRDREGPDCPVPFVLPAGVSVETGDRAYLGPGSELVLRRETVLRPDGNLTTLTRLILNPPPR
jgi:hypothetical protein